MPTTSDYVASTFGVMGQAHEFIMAHVSEPAYIYNMASQYHVTNASWPRSRATAARTVVKLDTYSGVLSTASLHASIVALTGAAAYDQAFSAAPYDTNHDGVLDASELGTSAVGSLPATEASIESIFYGTVINALKSFDATELNNLS
jgi:hypothetical protein